MRRISTFLIIALASAAIGLTAGRSVAAVQAQETNYLAIEEFQLGPDQTPAEAIERLSGWVQALRATGRHSNVRLFLHDWGPQIALYIVSETNDWDAIGSIFADVLAADPGFMTRPLGFAGHSDNILTEIPVP